MISFKVPPERLEEVENVRESEKEGAVVEWKTNTIESITGSATVVENYELRLIT